MKLSKNTLTANQAKRFEEELERLNRELPEEIALVQSTKPEGDPVAVLMTVMSRQIAALRAGIYR